MRPCLNSIGSLECKQLMHKESWEKPVQCHTIDLQSAVTKHGSKDRFFFKEKNL